MKPKSDEEIAIGNERVPAAVEMTPWVGIKEASWAIVTLAVSLYALLTGAAG